MARAGRDHRDGRRRVPRPQARPRARDRGVTAISARTVRWALPVIVAGSALSAASVYVGDLGWQRGFDRTSALRSPIAATEAAIGAGRVTYAQRCQPCHGERGRGDGPRAASLDPRPADLVLHVPQHTDGELFYFIARGVPGSAMPAWRDELSDTERWGLVAYLRALGEGRP